MFIGFICLRPTEMKRKQCSVGSLVSSDVCCNSKENISSLFLASTFIHWSDNGPRNNPWDGTQKFQELNVLAHLCYGHRKSISAVLSHQHREMFHIRPLCNPLQLDCLLPSSLLSRGPPRQKKWKTSPPPGSLSLPVNVSPCTLYYFHLCNLSILCSFQSSKILLKKLIQKWQKQDIFLDSTAIGVCGRRQIDKKGSFFPVGVQNPAEGIRQMERVREWSSASERDAAAVTNPGTQWLTKSVCGHEGVATSQAGGVEGEEGLGRGLKTIRRHWRVRTGPLE